MEQVILVDENDNAIGVAEKLAAHRDAKLHRAFSIFIFNSKNEFLLQQRALDKYHCGGLWSNTCCSHPRPGESLESAAHRRLREEMGLACNLKHVSHIVYKAEFPNGLTEHEFDHIFVGYTDEVPVINETEVAAWRSVGLDDLRVEMKSDVNKFTPWFRMVVEGGGDFM